MSALKDGVIAQGRPGALSSLALSTSLDQGLDQVVSCTTGRERTSF